jgi:hypothetical protein
VNLVYFASGGYKEEYEDIPVDNVFLVDIIFNRKNNRVKSNKVVQLGMDALASVDLFKKNNIEIDYFVCINEGLYEGSGLYRINSDKFIGYTMPILKNPYIHIWSPKYYTRSRNLRIPYSHIELNETDKGYINPNIFSERKDSVVWKMKKEIIETILWDGNINISIKRDSIWSDMDKLDALFMNIRHYNNFFDKKNKIIHINRNTTIQDIIKIADIRNFENIGISPWNGGDYKDIFNFLVNNKFKSLKNITFYHLNKMDFDSIYKSNKLII